jgi:hypothetical protein
MRYNFPDISRVETLPRLSVGYVVFFSGDGPDNGTNIVVVLTNVRLGQPTHVLPHHLTPMIDVNHEIH